MSDVKPDNLAWCNCCRRYKDKTGWATWRCGDCAAKAAKVPKSFVTRTPPEPEAKPRLYNNAGQLIKQPKPKKTKATGAATPMASNTTERKLK